MKSNRWYGVMFLLQVLTLGAVMTSQGPGILPAASAQVMDSGAQRAQLVEEMKSLNTKMDRLLGLLEGGKLQVQAVTPDERKDERSRR